MTVRITEPGRMHTGTLVSMEKTREANVDQKHCYDVILKDERPGIQTMVVGVHERYIKIETMAEINLDAWEHALGIESDPTMSWDERRERVLNKVKGIQDSIPKNPDEGFKLI